MRRPATATAASLIAASLLAGCADGGAPERVEATITTPSPTRDPLPLPPGALLDEPSGPPATPYMPEKLDWEGSLNPRLAPAGALTPNVDRIRKRGRLIVGIDQSLYLLSYRDTATGHLRGLEVDLAQAIADDIFGTESGRGTLDLRFVDSAARADALNRGDVDVVIRTMSITPERAQQIEFSTPYLETRVRVLAPKDRGIESLNDLDGKTVCIVDGTNLAQMARTFAPNSSLLRTRSWSDCLMSTQQFQADAIMADDAILAGIAAQDPYTDILPGSLSTQYYGVGLPKGGDDIVRQVNSTIERMRNDGSLQQLYATWLGGSVVDASPPALRYRTEE